MIPAGTIRIIQRTTGGLRGRLTSWGARRRRIREAYHEPRRHAAEESTTRWRRAPREHRSHPEAPRYGQEEEAIWAHPPRPVSNSGSRRSSVGPGVSEHPPVSRGTPSIGPNSLHRRFLVHAAALPCPSPPPQVRGRSAAVRTRPVHPVPLDRTGRGNEYPARKSECQESTRIPLSNSHSVRCIM